MKELVCEYGQFREGPQHVGTREGVPGKLAAQTAIQGCLYVSAWADRFNARHSVEDSAYRILYGALKPLLPLLR